MSSLAKNIIRILLAIAVLTASAFGLAELSTRNIVIIGFFPAGVPTDIWIRHSVNVLFPGSIWLSFWVTLVLFVLWWIFWAIKSSNDLIWAVNRVTSGFWLALLFLASVQLVMVIIFFVHFNIVNWALSLLNFWVYFLPLAYVFPFAFCLIFFSKIGVEPFRKRGVSN